jgi:deoxyribodipyrimidine photo-lyase
VSQAERFDPTGAYVRKYVPELKNIKGKALLDPSKVLPKAEFAKLGYPAPMVDHKAARDECLAAFKAISGKADV